MTTTPQRPNAFTHATAKLSTLSNSKKAMLACGIAAGVVAAIVLTVSGVSAAATTRAQNDALRGAQTALSDLTTAQQTTSTNASAIGEALMAANSLVGDADNLVSISDGILDPTGRAAVAAASTTLKTTAQEAASSRSIDLTSGVSTSSVAKTTSPTVDETMSTAELHNTAEDLAKLASTETKAVKEGAALLEALAVQSDAVTEPLAGASANAIDNTDPLLAALTAATQPERDAIGNAATLLRTTLTEGGSLMKPLVDYATAARAGLDSNAAGLAAAAAGTGSVPAESTGSSNDSDGSYSASDDDEESYSGDNSGGSGAPSGNSGNNGAPAPAPAPAPEPEVDNNVHVQTNGNYVGCTDGFVIGTHSPGPGGTSAPGYGFPWGYSISGLTITFYDCA